MRELGVVYMSRLLNLVSIILLGCMTALQQCKGHAVMIACAAYSVNFRLVVAALV